MRKAAVMEAKSYRARWIAFAISVLCCGWSLSAFAAAGGPPPGRQATDWEGAVWLDAKPISLSQLSGKVVLIRWWTAPHCSYCSATAPALNEFHRKYRERGLQVIGFYHHKSPEPLVADTVRGHARRLGFEFPIAIDPDWRTLKQWWLRHGDHHWTSVSFLLDRHGVVRHIHPGGQYVKGDQDYELMKTKIEELLAEK
ncbi:MAG: peroxiredoxin family protein [Opitutaceae bacterium]